MTETPRNMGKYVRRLKVSTSGDSSIRITLVDGGEIRGGHGMIATFFHEAYARTGIHRVLVK
jgi:hypothetical protein